jgi:hypothetical protein
MTRKLNQWDPNVQRISHHIGSEIPKDNIDDEDLDEQMD